MHACSVTASSGKSDIRIIVVGASASKAPKAIEAEAARLASGDISGPVSLIVDGERFGLVKVRDDDWLVGGEAWRLLGSDVVKLMRASKLKRATVEVGGDKDQLQALVEGVILGDYLYTECRSGKVIKRSKLTVRIPGAAKAIKEGTAVAECQNIARSFSDAPPNALNPASFAKRVQVLAREYGLTCKVTSGIAALTKANFPGLIQVGQGSKTPPALVELRYVPKKGSAKAKKRLALVGKGMTFDSGGLSIKPSPGMWEMKNDCGGAAAVLGAMLLIARQQPKVPVTGYLALAENMPDGAACRPGDIYQARNGKFIHIDNTDAEGRLILSDVLTYACEQGATHMLDAATLTGACVVALGMGIAGLMSHDDKWSGQVRAAGLAVGEELWPLPLYGEYRGDLDHIHADVNNIGGSRWGGALTAGLFLSEFVDHKVKWAHCDIAGPAIRTGGWRYYAKGMTGFGVRSFARVAADL